MARISKYPDSAGVYKLTCLITNKIYIGNAQQNILQVLKMLENV